jgi:hypothetical protein
VREPTEELEQIVPREEWEFFDGLGDGERLLLAEHPLDDGTCLDVEAEQRARLGTIRGAARNGAAKLSGRFIVFEARIEVPVGDLPSVDKYRKLARVR